MLNNQTLPITPTTMFKSPIANKVLVELLQNIGRIDFVQLIQSDAGEELKGGIKQKHYIVSIVQEIVQKAAACNLGLCQRHDFIYSYNGKCWEVVERDALKCFLGLAAEKMGYALIEAKYFEFKDKLMKQFISAAHLPALEMEKETVLVNLQNGTLEITPSGRILREHRPADFLTYVLPFNYDVHAQCPLFMSYLQRVLPETESQQILAEFMGYAFTRQMKLEKCLLLYGDGANGKSVFFEVINSLMGRHNVSTLSLGHLKEEHNRAMLVNKLINYGSEINGNALEADLLKQLISGEPVQARLKYGNPFLMESYAKLAFNCNTLPQVTEYSEAYFRRFLIVPFNETIPEADRNPNLANDIIRGELAGVLSWILMGLDRILATQKFTASPKVKEVVANYRIASDTVASFLNERGIIPCNTGEMSFGDIYDKYKNYCWTDGYRAVSKKTFSERTKKLNYQHTRKSSGIVLHAGFSS